MDSPPQYSRDFLPGCVEEADLTAQFPFTWRVGGEGAQIQLQSGYVTSSMNEACSLLNLMGPFQFSLIASGTVYYSRGLPWAQATFPVFGLLH